MKLIIAALLILLMGCKSAEKIAADRAKKENIARLERIKLMEDARKQFPCDTITKYFTNTIERVLPGDTTVIDSIVYIRLPGKEITHTEVRTVVDKLAVESLLDQLESTRYAAQLQAEENMEQDKQINELEDKNDKIRERSRKLLFGLIGGGVLFAGCIFLRIKGIL